MSTASMSKTVADLDIRPLTGALGCEIFGVDVTRLDEPAFNAIYQAFLDYSVVQKKLSTQNLGWHMDHSYQKNPSLGAMLYAIDVPRAGGDTLFASHYLSYDYLSEPMQAFLEDKIGIHDVLHYGMESGHYAVSEVEALERWARCANAFRRSSIRWSAGIRRPGARCCT